MARDIIQSVWIGDRLSTMEQLAIQSFLDHGHPFHLYTYGPIANVPAGTTVKSGTAILAADAVFEALSSEWLSGALDWAAPQDSSATMTEEEADHG